jgi:hypothetical protein
MLKQIQYIYRHTRFTKFISVLPFFTKLLEEVYHKMNQFNQNRFFRRMVKREPRVRASCHTFRTNTSAHRCRPVHTKRNFNKMKMAEYLIRTNFFKEDSDKQQSSWGAIAGMSRVN